MVGASAEVERTCAKGSCPRGWGGGVDITHQHFTHNRHIAHTSTAVFSTSVVVSVCVRFSSSGHAVLHRPHVHLWLKKRIASHYGHKQVDRLVLVSRVSVMALMTVPETINPNERFLTVLVCGVRDQTFVFHWTRRVSPRKTQSSNVAVSDSGSGEIRLRLLAMWK